MVVRYGAINDSVGEVTLENTYTNDDTTEARQSDNSLSIWDKYRNFLTGMLKYLEDILLYKLSIFRNIAVLDIRSPLYNK